MFKNVREVIDNFDQIVIYRHVRPDGDAMFSAYALYLFLKDNFKDKKIKVAGFEKYDLINKIDKVSDKFIKNSLAICLDSSTPQRIDDQRFVNSKYILKIDHHPVEKPYGDFCFVNNHAGACAEVLYSLFISKEFKDCTISKKVCEYLYCGILTDTLNFRTSSTTPTTLLYASQIAQKGELIPAELSIRCFDKDLKFFDIETDIRTKLQIKDKFGYVIIKQKDLDKYGLTSDQVKSHINAIGTIAELNVWTLFVYDSKNKCYDASLRSKPKYRIDTTARQYDGGGHKCACGIKRLSVQQLNEIIEKLALISKK